MTSSPSFGVSGESLQFNGDVMRIVKSAYDFVDLALAGMETSQKLVNTFSPDS